MFVLLIRGVIKIHSNRDDLSVKLFILKHYNLGAGGAIKPYGSGFFNFPKNQAFFAISSVGTLTGYTFQTVTYFCLATI